MRLAVLFAVLMVFASAARAETEPPSVVIVFDGSGSMWSRMPGTQMSRLVAGRDGVKAGLAELKVNMRAGLIALGHRQQGSCSDIQTIVPLDGGDNARIGAALDKLNPRGKGPIVQAVREAAQLLKSAKGDKHIVLLHDDPDNCQQDPCAAAREIAAADPGLRIHVVSIGMRPDDAGRPLCLARTTGGRAVAADTAADVTREVTELIANLTSLPPALVEPPTAAKRPSSAQPERPAATTVAPEPARTLGPRTLAKTGPPHLMLGARIAAGQPLVDAPLHWTVTSADGRVVTAAAGATPELALAPGSYKVSVDTGGMTANGSVDVNAEGGTELVLDLNAALVRLSAAAKKGGGMYPSASLTLKRAGDGQVVWIGFGESPPLAVPPGEFVVEASDGVARARQTITAVAGKTADVALALEAGRIKLAAVARDGGPALTDVVYQMLEDDPDASRGQREVARSSAAAPDLVLPAGSYTVVASHGGAETRERIIVKPGEDVAKVIVLGLARVRFAVKLQGPADSANWPIQYTLRRLDPAPAAGGRDVTVVSGSIERRPVVSVAPGRWRVELRAGEHNARIERDVDLRPGSELSVTQAIPAAELNLSLAASASSLASPETIWEITPAGGGRTIRTMQARPRLLLAPGAYTLTVEGRSARVSRTLDIPAGQVKVEVGLQ